jgi:predicted nucleic acid-binding protein
MALSWIISDERDDIARAAAFAVAKEGALVPALWFWEIQNVLLVAERRKRVSGDDIDVALGRLAALPVSVGPLARLGNELDLARRMNISAYDASYLQLALTHRAPLMTRDERLAKAAGAMNILWQPARAARRRRK